MPDQKEYEVETLRRLFAPMHEKRKQPSGLKGIFTWLCSEKVMKSTPLVRLSGHVLDPPLESAPVSLSPYRDNK